MDMYEEMLLQIVDVLKKHNRPLPDLTHKEAIEEIRFIVNKAYYSLEERPKGKWKYTPNGIIYCNLCNHYLGFRGNFCPNCGADMRVDEEEMS